MNCLYILSPCRLHYLHIFSPGSFCCCCSVAKECLTLCFAIDCRCQASLSFTISWSLFKLMSIKLMMLSNHLILTLCFPIDCRPQAFMSFTISWSLLKLMSIKLMMLSNHLILCCPCLLLPSIFPTIRVFSSELTLHIRWPKYWSFSFSISPSKEYSGLISFRIDWFDLLPVQGTEEPSPAPQFESINSSVLNLLYGPTLTSICNC